MIDDQSGNERRLDWAVRALEVSPTGWLILDRTIGPGNSSSLAQVAEEFRLPIERIERIRKRSVENICRNIGQIMFLLRDFEQEFESGGFASSVTTSGTKIVEEMRRVAQRRSWQRLHAILFRNLIIALRTVAIERSPIVQSLPKIVLAVSQIDPPLDLLSLGSPFDGDEDLDPGLDIITGQRSRRIVTRNTPDSGRTIVTGLSSVPLPVSSTTTLTARLRRGSHTVSKQSQPSHTPTRDLAAALSALGLNERQWFVLERRLGPDNDATLENVSRDVGVTRERVRQLQKKAVQAIYCNLDLLFPLLRILDAGLNANWLTPSTRAKGDALIDELGTIANRGGWSASDANTVRNLVVAVRVLVDEHPKLAQELPNLSFATCLIDPPIRAHEAVSQSLDRWEREDRERERNWTYDELAETVLRQAGEPLHWSAMAEQAEELGRRESFSKSGFFNAVSSNDAMFARVDTGTYGLTEWGFIDVANYTDIVAEILSEHGRPLTEGAIYQEVNSRRRADHNSLRVTIQT